MRIAILTFVNALNLGAALQAFSLQKALEEMGNDVELIDYRCPAIEVMHKMHPVFQSGLSVKAFIYNCVFFPRRVQYKQFRKRMRKSKAYTRDTIASLDGQYDAFITGSDQVFNLKLTGNDSTYFLDFVHSGKKISYAASLGLYLPEKKEEYRTYLQSFTRLSLREKSSKELFQEELGMEAEVMPDPVFLHTGEEWKKLLDIKEKRSKDKYILVYSLMETKELYQIADVAAKKYGLKTVVITKALRTAGRVDHVVRNAGPREFIELMVNAEYVVTNSFHGTAFSLILEKQFVTLLPSSAPERILDLLNEIGLGERAIRADKDFPDNGIHYEDYRLNIDAFRKKGNKYLAELF